MIIKSFHGFSQRLIGLLKSRGFYVFILGLFAFEAVWIAFSAAFPQAFDEDFHFGLIRLYSHHWLPFLSGQPAGADVYGAVARDPSYLYHYLMSFPYRFLNLFIHSQAGQVIAFRLIDIGLFLWGIILFKRLLERIGLSRGLINMILLVFILIPIVPQLAAQANYDDLLFPLTALVFLFTFKVIDQLRQRQPSAVNLLTLFCLMIYATLVKYAFLPVAFSAVIFVSIFALRNYRHDLKNLGRGLLKSYRLQLARSIFLSIFLMVAIGLMAQREGYNLIKYHAIVPNCSRILSVKQCSAYSPWYTDYSRHNDMLAGRAVVTYNIGGYTTQWFYWMWYRLFFAINGVGSNFFNDPPLPLPGVTSAVLAIASGLAIIRWRKKIFDHNPYRLFLMLTCVLYCLVLFVKGYVTYRYTAYLENMNGRYLLPILLPLAAMAGLAFSQALRKSIIQKAMAALIVLVLFLEGGGLLNFLVRSDDSWYWRNRTVVKVNQAAHNVAKHVVVQKLRKSKT